MVRVCGGAAPTPDALAALAREVAPLATLEDVLRWGFRCAPPREELLADRLATGFAPTPTGTVDGDVIMGHAACTVVGK
jgi:hypothetical protein